MSWLELSPAWWFGVAFAAAVAVADLPTRRRLVAGGASRGASTSSACSASRSVLVHSCRASAIWSPYYKITVQHRDAETIVEVNNIFHQSMAPVEQKEYFYQWPYMAFGNTFKNVLILGAGSGTDVAAALRHGVEHVDAVEIDPVIIRPRAGAGIPTARTTTRASPSSTTTRGTSCGRRPRSTTWSCSR